MSKRLTPKWTKTAEEAHGTKGAKGKEGEIFFVNTYKSLGWDTIHHESSIREQVGGIDVTLKKEDKIITVDVKNNLTKYDEIVIEVQHDGWLFNPKKKSDFISHVNPTTKKIASYRRTKMQDYINEHFWDYRNDIMYLKKSECPDFVKWTSA